MARRGSPEAQETMSNTTSWMGKTAQPNALNLTAGFGPGETPCMPDGLGLSPPKYAGFSLPIHHKGMRACTFTGPLQS